MGAEKHQIAYQSPDGEFRVVELPEEGVVGVGSSAKCAIVVDGLLPVHCYLKTAAGKAFLFVKAENALVLVNDAPARKRALSPGDRITVGDVELAYEMTDALLGSEISGYRIDDRLGHGMTGTVYRATQLSLNRTVAVKILSPELTRDRAFVERFLREAQVVARLNHPNVVPIYDAAEIDGIFFFSMEYLPGGTLEDILREEGTLDVETALRAIHDTAQALVWAEEQGIVHRDIKPGNLLISQNGTIKLADLGLAIEAQAGPSGGRSRWVGSPRYMAPEQALGKPVDHRADIYGLGATLFRAVSGRFPFDGSKPVEILQAKIKDDPPRLDAVTPNVPRAVADLVETMIARDPASRPASCVELLAAVEETIAAVESGPVRAPVAAAPHVSHGPARPARRPAKRLNPAVTWSAVGAAAVLALVLVLVALKNGTSSRSGVTTVAGGQPGAGDPTVDAREDDPGQSPEGSSPAPPPVRPDRSPQPEPESPRVVVDTPSGDGENDAVFRQLRGILTRYQRGLLTPEDAIARLEDFRRRFPASQYASAADVHLDRIRKERARANREIVLAEIQKSLPSLMTKRQFHEAGALLDRMLVNYPENREQIDPFVTELDAAASAEWEKRSAELEQLLAAGRFAEAKKRLDEAPAALPESFAAKIADAAARLEREQQSYTELAATIADVERRFARAISSLDFAAAAGLVDSLPESPAGSPAKGLVDALRARLSAEAGLCEETWERVVDGVRKAMRERRAVELDESERPAEESDYRIVKLDGATIEVEVSRDRRVRRNALAISSAELGAMSGQGASADEGIGLLLLHADRPFRARKFLQSPSLGAEKLAHYRQLLTRAEEKYLATSIVELSRRYAELGKSGSGTTLEDWRDLEAELARFIANARTTEKYAAIRDGMATMYVAARVESLRPAAPGNLFHGRIKSYRGGKIELVYDFEDSAELRDFHPKLSTGCQARLTKKTLEVVGEYRFARGNPFRREITVTGAVPARGYKLASPNINVAIWTQDEDRITPALRSISSSSTGRGSGGTSTGSGGTIDPPIPVPDAVPQDYFVFGLGLKTRDSSIYSSYYTYNYLRVPGLNTIVPMPALILLGGVRGRPILTYANDEGIWGEGVVNKVKGKQVFRIHLEPNKVLWAINGRSMPINKSTLLDRFRRSEVDVGSVTIFTNGERVFFASLGIEGELNPAWIDEELARIARDDLKRLESAKK